MGCVFLYLRHIWKLSFHIYTLLHGGRLRYNIKAAHTKSDYWTRLGYELDIMSFNNPYFNYQK
jgi:hypothetical protein